MLKELQGATYIIQPAAGMLIKKGVLANSTVDVQKLSPGLYWISIEADRQLFRASFMKQ